MRRWYTHTKESCLIKELVGCKVIFGKARCEILFPKSPFSSPSYILTSFTLHRSRSATQTSELYLETSPLWIPQQASGHRLTVQTWRHDLFLSLSVRGDVYSRVFRERRGHIHPDVGATLPSHHKAKYPPSSHLSFHNMSENVLFISMHFSLSPRAGL